MENNETLKRDLEVRISLTSDDAFDVEIYEPESGDFTRVNCHDSITEEETKEIISEILSWVVFAREEMTQ